MMQSPEVSAAVVTLPPRPNLGPEPWHEPPMIPWIIGGLAILAGALSLVAARRARRAPPVDRPQTAEPAAPVGLIETAQRLRDVLAGEFGNTWHSKTTEEILGDSEMRGRLSDELILDLERVFALADGVKFRALDEPPIPENLSGIWSAVEKQLRRDPIPSGS